MTVQVSTWQKRPIHMAKETYSYGKRDLFIWQQRPIHMAKETYSYGKRDLFIWQKRPIHMEKVSTTSTTRRQRLSTYENIYVCNTERKRILRVEVDDVYGSGFRV